MAKKLKVTQPVTIDGKNLAYDEDKKPLVTTSIVELSAKKEFEKFNEQLPDHLKYTFEEVEEGETEVAKPLVDISKLEAEVEQANKTVAAKDEALAAKEAEVEQANKTVAAKDEALAAKEAEVEQANKTVADLQKQLEEAKKSAAKK
jgi:chromosome segregation ATPase